MIIIEPSYTIEKLAKRQEILENLERYGRVCYKSEDKITENSASKFCCMLISRNHVSVIEHESMTVRFICDRGVTHELVRHRLASFSQESTRYCNYSKNGLTFINPPWGFDEEAVEYLRFVEKEYNRRLQSGQTPQQARGCLPNEIKTEIVVIVNLREWLHIFELRTHSSAHPQMRQLMVPLKEEIKETLPELFK